MWAYITFHLVWVADDDVVWVADDDVVWVD